MSDEASTDHGTVLGADTCGIIIEDGSIAMLMPSIDDANEREMSHLEMYIAACFMRGNADPEFVDEMVEWLGGQMQ